MPPTWRRVELRGFGIALESWGDPAAPRVVILHGLLDTGAAWGRVACGLEGFHVLAPDARGHGRSDHVGPGGIYHFADYVRDLDALVEHLGPPLHLVGHSMGATVASMYAGLVPENVRTLTLIEGLGPPSEDDGAAVARFRQHLLQMRDPPAPSRVADLDEATARLQRVNPGLTDEQARAIAERNTDDRGGGRVWTWDPLHRTRSPIGFDLDRYFEMLRRILAPTTVVLGTESWYRAVDRLPERIEACRAELVELPGGHTPHLDHPEELSGVILERLNSLNSSIS